MFILGGNKYVLTWKDVYMFNKWIADLYVAWLHFFSWKQNELDSYSYTVDYAERAINKL